MVSNCEYNAYLWGAIENNFPEPQFMQLCLVGGLKVLHTQNHSRHTFAITELFETDEDKMWLFV